MKNMNKLPLALGLAIFAASGCGGLKNNEAERTANNTPVTNQTVNKQPTGKPTDGAASTVAEREKPASGKGNIQGKVLFDGAPAAGIEVRVCENFSMIVSLNCTGTTAMTKTDAEGIYVLPNLEPKIYGGLTAKVFDSKYFLSPQEGILKPQKFEVIVDKTIFARDIHLYKNNLKVVSPKSGSKVAAANLKLEWSEYPNAEYYKVSLSPETAGAKSPVNAERVEGSTSFTVDEPLTNGKHRIKIEAYNKSDRKLAESDNDIKFTVTGGAEPVATP